MNLFCNLATQKFVQGFRNPALTDLIVTQNNDTEAKIYLLQPNGSARFPFMYDPSSGDNSLTAKAILCNPGGLPFTLTQPSDLAVILNGFRGTISTDTNEIETFLANTPERKCQLAIEVTEGDGSRVTAFQGELTLRRAATSVPATVADLYVTKEEMDKMSGEFPALAISTAGTSILAPVAPFIQWFQLVTVAAGAGVYTRILVLDTSMAKEGAIFRIEIDLAASSNPTIEIRDATADGTLLETITGDSSQPGYYAFQARFSNGSWKKLTGAYQT